MKKIFYLFSIVWVHHICYARKYRICWTKSQYIMFMNLFVVALSVFKLSMLAVLTIYAVTSENNVSNNAIRSCQMCQICRISEFASDIMMMRWPIVSVLSYIQREKLKLRHWTNRRRVLKHNQRYDRYCQGIILWRKKGGHVHCNIFNIEDVFFK